MISSIATAATTAIIAGIFSVITWYGKTWLENKKKFDPARNTFAQHTVLMTELINTLQTRTIDMGAIRAIIVKVHNCGGYGELGKPLYTTVCAQAFHPPARQVETWEKVPIDSSYTEFLHELTTKGRAVLDTDSIPEDHAIRSVYKNSGIDHSQAFYLTGDKTCFFFLSVAFPTPKIEDFSKVENLQRLIRKQVYKISEISRKLGIKGHTII